MSNIGLALFEYIRILNKIHQKPSTMATKKKAAKKAAPKKAAKKTAPKKATEKASSRAPVKKKHTLLIFIFG